MKQHKLQIEYLNVDELTPYENNARKHDDDDVSMIENSIEQFDFNDPIGIWGEKNIIVEGHGRLLAAKKAGLTEVPCIRLDHLTEEQRKAYTLAHNKTAENSSWDFDELEKELASIPDIDMSGFGFDLDFDVDEPVEVVEDDYDEEPPAKPKSKLGDIYQLGRHRLMCGDSTKAEDMSALMGDDKADMVFTDPPYNVAIGSKNAFLNSVQPSGRCCEDIANDKGMSDEEIGETLWLPAFERMRENSKDCCNIYVTMPQGGTHMMMMMMMKAGWQVKHELMWEKNSPTFSMGRLDYDYQHEPICYGWNKSHVFYGKGEQNKSIWKFDKPRKCDLHPTMKPIPLVVNALLNSSKENDIILDAFGGSGTTIMACEQTKRNARLMEFDPKYVDVIIDRWEKFTGQKAVKLN